jgi:hypothetical protein
MGAVMTSLALGTAGFAKSPMPLSLRKKQAEFGSPGINGGGEDEKMVAIKKEPLDILDEEGQGQPDSLLMSLDNNNSIIQDHPLPPNKKPVVRGRCSAPPSTKDRPSTWTLVLRWMNRKPSTTSKFSKFLPG